MIELVYWNIRGLLEPIIAVLEYLKVDYKIKRFEDQDEWAKMKEGLIKKGNHFINLPHLIDGEKIVNESTAILNYINGKYGQNKLSPNFPDMIEYIQLNGVLKDINSKVRSSFYSNKTLESLKEEYKQNFETFLKFKLQGIDSILEKNDWLISNKLTLCDFFFVEIVEVLLTFEKENNLNLFSSFKNFQNYLTRFENLEEIKIYRNSDRFLKRPFNAPIAIWY